MPCCCCDPCHGTATVLLDSTPVEVITSVQDEVWVFQRSTSFKCVGNQQLRLCVNTCYEATTLNTAGALVLTTVETCHELVMRTQQLTVSLVPPRPGENMRTRSLSPLVGDDARTASWLRIVRYAFTLWMDCTIHSTPISDCKDVCLPCAANRHGWPFNTLVAKSRAGRAKPTRCCC